MLYYGLLSDVCCILTALYNLDQDAFNFNENLTAGTTPVPLAHAVTCLPCFADLHFHAQKTGRAIVLLVEKAVCTSEYAGPKMFGIQQCSECFSCCFSQQLHARARIADALLQRDSALYVFVQIHLRCTHIWKHSQMNVEPLNMH